jgi:hypothetical protein
MHDDTREVLHYQMRRRHNDSRRPLPTRTGAPSRQSQPNVDPKLGAAGIKGDAFSSMLKMMTRYKLTLWRGVQRVGYVVQCEHLWDAHLVKETWRSGEVLPRLSVAEGAGSEIDSCIKSRIRAGPDGVSAA